MSPARRQLCIGPGNVPDPIPADLPASLEAGWLLRMDEENQQIEANPLFVTQPLVTTQMYVDVLHAGQ